MALATLTTKGQVTIPTLIRETLKLHCGDKIEIIVTKNREELIRPISKKVDDVFSKLYRSTRKTISVESMNDAIKNRMKGR